MTETTHDLPRILAEHRKWLRGEGGSRAYLSGANLSDAALSGANLSDAALSGANLARANLSDAALSGANLARAYLSGAYLLGANLSGANLLGANLSGANLSRAKHLIDGGQRLDGYRFVGWIKGGALMIRAGCRNLTLSEYRTHNAARSDVALRDETSAILDHIEAVARVRGLLG